MRPFLRFSSTSVSVACVSTSVSVCVVSESGSVCVCLCVTGEDIFCAFPPLGECFCERAYECELSLTRATLPVPHGKPDTRSLHLRRGATDLARPDHDRVPRTRAARCRGATARARQVRAAQ